MNLAEEADRCRGLAPETTVRIEMTAREFLVLIALAKIATAESPDIRALLGGERRDRP